MKTMLASLLVVVSCATAIASPSSSESLLSYFLADKTKALATTTNKTNGVNPESGIVKKESVYVVDGYRYTLWLIDWKEKPDEFRIYVRKNGTTGNDKLDGLSLTTDSEEPTAIMVGDKSWDKDHYQHPEKPEEELSAFAQSHLARLKAMFGK